MNSVTRIIVPTVFLLLWSGGFTVAKIGISYAEPMTLLALRYVCVVVLLLPFYIYYRPTLPVGIQWVHLSFVGFLIQCVYFGGAYFAFLMGVSAGGVAIITSLQPILVALVMPLLHHEKVSGRRWLGLLLGLLGATIVIVFNTSVSIASFLGLVFSVAAMLAIALATVWEKIYGTEQHPLTSNLVQYTVGALVMIPVAWSLEEMQIEWSGPFFFALCYLVVGNSILAISLLLMMIRRGEATRVSGLFFLIPPVSALIAWMVLGEQMAVAAWLGMAVAAAGVYIVMRN